MGAVFVARLQRTCENYRRAAKDREDGRGDAQAWVVHGDRLTEIGRLRDLANP